MWTGIPLRERGIFFARDTFGIHSQFWDMLGNDAYDFPALLYLEAFSSITQAAVLTKTNKAFTMPE